MAKPGNMPLHDTMQVTISVAGVRAQLKRRYNSASTSLWASSSFTGQLGRGLFLRGHRKSAIRVDCTVAANVCTRARRGNRQSG